jgi:hypothetical protein
MPAASSAEIKPAALAEPGAAAGAGRTARGLVGGECTVLDCDGGRSFVMEGTAVELSTMMMAWSGSTAGFQPLMVPSRASKRNSAGADLPFSEITKSDAVRG